MSSALHQRLSVETELSKLATELLETFTQLETHAGQELDSQQLLRNYIRYVTRCGLAAGRAGAAQLQDHCVHFQGILKSLQVQPAHVVKDYQHVLEQWPLLLMSQIHSDQDAAFSQQLDELVYHTHWPDASPPQASPQTVPTSDMMPTPDEPEPDAPALPADQVALDEVQASHAELQAELDDALRELLHLDTSADATMRQRIIDDCADRLELFAVSAAAAGFFGLMDVAQLFQTALRNQVTTHTPDDPGWQQILDLHSAMAAYLHPASPVNAATTLMEALQHFLAPNQLDQTESIALTKLLADDDLAATGTATEAPTEAATLPAITSEHAEPTGDQAVSTEAISLSPQAFELLQLITTEFEPLSAGLAAHLQTLFDPMSTSDQRQAAGADYTAGLQRFVEVFDSIGLDGLSRLFSIISQHVQQPPPGLLDDIDAQFWLAEWPAHVITYLADPCEQAEDLIGHCQANGSPVHSGSGSAQELFTALRSPQIDSGEEEAAPRQTVATPEDVSLQLPADVNPQLLESLLQELPHQTAEFTRVIGNIVQGQGSLPDIETAQRLAHTLKGAANTVGVAGIANLTHHLEDILLAFTREQVLPVTPLTTTLQDAADVLEMMSEALLGMGPAPEQQALAVLQQILDWANQIDLNGLPEASSQAVSEISSPAETPIPAGTAVADNSLRISTQSVDETLRLIGEATIVNAQLQEALRRSLAHNRSMHAQSELFQQLAFELEQLIDVRGMHGLLSGLNNSAFDALEMDQYNELHTLTRRMVEAATDTRTLSQYAEDELKNLEGLLHQQKRHTKDTQDVVMKTRMLPLQTIVPRLQRSVRQTCRLTGKQAELVISGADTLIDNDILAGLADPLMHILRNAVDHGIEAPALREASGKPQNGRITLAVSREGEHILIRCQDDGAGLDFAAIKRVALEKGVVQQDEILSSEILTRLIFVSGLTTRQETTQMSGRGIGMDAVYSQINEMKGTIRVSSEAQAGVLVEIQLPATLVTLHGILVHVRNQVLVIANRGVEQLLYADDGEIRRQDDREFAYLYKDETYHAYFLEDLLGIARPSFAPDEIKRPAMLLNTGDGQRVAILIERILNTQDVVIKKLGAYVPPLNGVEGVTILGDGSVAAVMDLAAVLANHTGSQVIPHIESADSDGIQSGAPKVLVVDDSLSARNSLAEFMRDSGYRVCTARDGMDAIAQLETEAPDILLVDMEMPRMNGLELAAYVRANQSTQKLPIIMITSRASDKHRDEAYKAGVNAYLTKPYSESEVLDQITAQLTHVFSSPIH